MLEDLKIIKKNYGEKMAHLCRELFPTLLEEKGYLSNFMLKTFDPSRTLYNDIIDHGLKEQFRNFVNGQKENVNYFETDKTPQELLAEVGYDLYHCKTEQEVQQFVKYYYPGEELCTFNGGRTNRCHVFFAVKKGAENLDRKAFKLPQREDEYGTSVISIQFTRGEVNNVSIKNRYNESVSNPDATFSNNLDNIVTGLTDSFRKQYKFNLENTLEGFQIPGYVSVDGKFYKYNYTLDNVYYCVNNMIVENNKKIEYMPERVIVFDYFLLDLQNKTLTTYKDKLPGHANIPGTITNHRLGEDTFVNTIGKIKDIKILRDKTTNTRTIYLKTVHKEIVEIELDNNNRMIRYKNNNLRRIPDGFLEYNEHLEVLEANNVKTIGNNCLRLNDCIKELHLRNTYEIGENFLFFNRTIQKAIFPRSFVVNDGFFGWNQDPNSKPLRIENNDINIMKYNDIHSEGLLQSFVSALKRRFYNLYNYFVDDREMDFTDDGITISKVEKNNAFTALKKLLINKKLTEKELEAVEDISEITKGM